MEVNTDTAEHSAQFGVERDRVAASERVTAVARREQKVEIIDQKWNGITSSKFVASFFVFISFVIHI